MHGRIPSRRTGRGAWFLIGGGVEPGETLERAAAREIVEETGFTDVALGPVVWRREGELLLREGPVWMDEHYFVARHTGGDPARHGWQPDEHDLIDDIRWWTLEELRATEERVFPPGLADLLAALLAEGAPAEPLSIDW